MDAFTLLGDTMHPAFGHPKMLARAYNHVYYEGREMGNLPLRGKKSVDQSATVYRVEYAQIVHRLSTLTRINCEKFVRPMPTSLVHPEMVYPNKRYEAYCLKVPESGPVAQYEPVSNYKMDGLRPRINLRPGAEVPVYPEDDVDANVQTLGLLISMKIERWSSLEMGGDMGKSNSHDITKRHKCIITMKGLKLQSKQRDLTELGHLVGKQAIMARSRQK